MAEREEEQPQGAPAWMATFSDAMTLLMTFFILLMTFSTTSPFKNLAKNSSIVGNKGGSGSAGEESTTADLDSIVLRDLSLFQATKSPPSETKPLYSEPIIPSTEATVRVLDEKPIGTLKDEYLLRLSVPTLFESKKKLSRSGVTILSSLARNVHSLPYELTIEIVDPENFPQAYAICEFLFRQGDISPTRLGIGVHSKKLVRKNSVFIRFVRTQ